MLLGRKKVSVDSGDEEDEDDDEEEEDDEDEDDSESSDEDDAKEADRMASEIPPPLSPRCLYRTLPGWRKNKRTTHSLTTMISFSLGKKKQARRPSGDVAQELCPAAGRGSGGGRDSPPSDPGTKGDFFPKMQKYKF